MSALRTIPLASCRRTPRVIAIEEHARYWSFASLKRGFPRTKYVAVLRFGRYGIQRVPVKRDIALWLMGVR